MFSFSHWALNNNKYDFSSPVTTDITLKAVWTKTTSTNPSGNQGTTKPSGNTGNQGGNTGQTTTPKPKTYTVRFDSAGGSYNTTVTVEHGKTVKNPGVPTRAGYTFTGWTFNGSAYDFATPVGGNITLVAAWKQNATYSYSVSQIDPYTPSMKVNVFDNTGKDISATVTLWTAGGGYLGSYSSEYGAIVIDKAQVASIGAIKVNGTLTPITKR